MSVATTNYVRSRRDLTPTELTVAYAMASHANPAKGQMCTASVPTIAAESHMTERGVRKIIRRLEAKPVPVIFARSTKAGGRHKATAYEFNDATGNPEPPFPLSGDGNPERLDPETRNGWTGNPEPGFPQEVLERKERENRALALEEVWTYYLAETGKTVSSFTSKRQEAGKARLEESLQKVNGDLSKAVMLMKCAVDGLTASDFHMGRQKGSTETFNEWEHVFGTTEKFETRLEAANRG